MKITKAIGTLLAAGALIFALAGTTSAAGPGNNGLDPTGNGTKSDATVNGSHTNAEDSALMANSGGDAAFMTCDGDSVGSVGGVFTLLKTLDVGSKITVYLVPNNGSDANPAANVTKNELTITLGSGNHTSGSKISWLITVTHAFTESKGGVLGVFAVNTADPGADGVAISSSKTNSLNCNDGQQSSSSSSSSSSETSFTGSQSGESSSSAASHPLPPTSAFGDGSGPTDHTWMLVAAAGMLLGSLLVLAPARIKNRR
ncbi:MAG TPA: hypothetical protein VJ506_08945 [Candidatus Limnocylindrales bacterium]|nr:hypothetical protein [Candidatus Limnocylindrales bacterium]